jgi:hypothetical protein
MQRILGLSALGLLVLAGTSPAQQPITGGDSSSVPVVQSAPSGSYAPSSSGRRFGRWRARNNYDNGPRPMYSQTYRGSNVVTGPSEVQAVSGTGQPVAERIPAMPREGSETAVKTETSGSTTQPVVQSSSPMVQQPQNNSGRRNGSRGGLLARLAARRGR